MNNVTEFCVTASPETVLKKLSRENIAVYKLRKSGAKLYFGVNQEYVKKVFAIFAHPCYNTVIRRKSGKSRLAEFLKRRLGVVVGAVLFCVLAVFSGQVVFGVKVTGSGSYLSAQVLKIAAECGARKWSLGKGLDKPVLQARVLALPQVNFCSVQRRGSFIIIDVHAEEEHTALTKRQPLKSDIKGEIYRLVAICGTAEKSEGDKVEAGDVLIGAYTVSEDGEKIPCVAVGFAEIKSGATLSLFYECESEQNTKKALSSSALYSDRVIEKSYKVRPCDGGVTYEVSFTYIKTLAVNME